MRPTALGIISILFGLAILGLGAVAGGQVIIMGVGFLFIILGGLTKRKEPTVICPHCRSRIDPAASVCPHCQREIKPAFNVVCPSCGKGFNVLPAAFGHVARCPHCGKMTPTKKPADIEQRKEGAP